MAEVQKHTLPREHGSEKGIQLLYGSSTQPSTWEMKDGGILQLGDVVRLAWKISRLSIETWNALPEEDREERIAQALKHYKNEIKGDT